MTMTAEPSTLTFWPTTWGHLTVGDLIKDPAGDVWEITAGVEADIKEWCVVNTATGLFGWVSEPDASPVSAARPKHPHDPTAEARAVHMLREAFGEVTQVTSGK